ncbi:hypothetical protein EJ06DRAFT_194096 [Trichodelitschia bisporula]|uniref:SRR1-like domain-containing protein n=1 Tax=Trichodelitschia bisporula TaxID=703511 RepID=A0A6G1I7T3_9PEZI|nr:hypothetical protein EJ06DRAFT_194096 [Trichodelitschia bisporula]
MTDPNLHVHHYNPAVDRARAAALAKQRIKRLVDAYAQGRPLFPRAVLEDVDRQLSAAPAVVTIEDFEGVRKEYKLDKSRVRPRKSQYPRGRVKVVWRPAYHSYEQLVHDAEARCGPPYPAPITLGLYVQDVPSYPLRQVASEFEHHRGAWEASGASSTLIAALAAAPVARRITKIVAFGLGSLSRLGCPDTTRAAVTQHCALVAMAAALRDLHGRGVACYAQDPAYTDVDADILARLGVGVVDDPRGFLAVDERTLVFAVSPDVPVKQIVVDGPWPAAMVWNTVLPEARQMREWSPIEGPDGLLVTVSPFCTDPDSLRVRDMVQHYDEAPFHTGRLQWGRLSMYTRRRVSRSARMGGIKASVE